MVTRRQFLQAGAGLGALALTGWPRSAHARSVPDATVALAHCPTYDLRQVVDKLGAALSLIGGLRSLVEGRTVTIKLNLTGDVAGSFQGVPAQRSYQTHSSVAFALVYLLDAAGAQRIRLVESTYRHEELLDQLMMAGWDISLFQAIATPVEFEDTRNLGLGAEYTDFPVPGGGLIFPSYLLNHSYAETDVFISLAKLKEHGTAGVTLALKNNFGITPLSLYGNNAGSEDVIGHRSEIFHFGSRQPPEGVPPELDPTSSREATWRAPHITVDQAACRPIDLSIIDGIETMRGGEGPWVPGVWQESPGLLIVGRDPVATDAVSMDRMGHDPQAADGTPPFQGVNHVALAAAAGLGTNDLSRIEVREVGVDLATTGVLIR